VVKFIKFTHKLYERFASAVRKKKTLVEVRLLVIYGSVEGFLRPF